MSWAREQVSHLIDEYQKYPCLYAVKSKDYKNKHSRIRALEAIQRSLSLVKPNVSINDIKAKFHVLKTNFLAEHRKYQKSVHSGMVDDEVYIPTIWYYEQMGFVLEHCVVRVAVDAITHNDDGVVKASVSNVTPETESLNESHRMEDDSQTQTFNYEVLKDNTLKQVEADDDLSEVELVLPASSSVMKPIPKSGTPSPSPAGSSARTPGIKRKRDNADKAIEDAADAIKAMTNVMQ